MEFAVCNPSFTNRQTNVLFVSKYNYIDETRQYEKRERLGMSVRFAKINKPLKWYIENNTYLEQTSIYDHYSTADHIFYLQCLGIMNNNSFAFHMPRCFVHIVATHRRYSFNESACTMSPKDIYFWKRKCLRKLQGNHVFSQLEVRRGNKLAPPTTRRRNLLSGGGLATRSSNHNHLINNEEGFLRYKQKWQSQSHVPQTWHKEAQAST